jgi:hypothetical protein
MSFYVSLWKLLIEGIALLTQRNTRSIFILFLLRIWRSNTSFCDVEEVQQKQHISACSAVVAATARHKGYPGGCRKCRRRGTVYDEVTGVQKCLHHESCTPAFLEWEKQRYEELSLRVSCNIPESEIPTWESVGALREECWKRCKTPTDRAEFRKKKHMHNWKSGY